MMHLKCPASLLLAFCSITITPLLAEVRLPAIVGNDMVLQRDTTLPVWGWASPRENVTIAIAGQNKTATANSEGEWSLTLDPLSTGGPLDMTISGKNTVTLTNILVGDVWICSGQSNMEWPMALVEDSKREISRATHPKIKLFQVRHVAAERPQIDCGGRWVSCGPSSVPGFSAVGYFFGKELHQELEVPVGLIASTWSGSAAEAWMREDVLRAKPEYQDILEKYEADLAEYKSVDNLVRTWKQWEKEQIQWSEDIKQRDADGKPRPDPPTPPTILPPNFLPGALYDGMIAPLQKCVIKGVIWYQGESNAFAVDNGPSGVRRASQYRTLFPDLIRSWRKDWALGDFPFYFVQIAPFDSVYETGSAPLLREAQFMTLRSVPNTGMVVTTDIGNVHDIHPRNKQDVGRRLALWALANGDCRKDIVHSGPLYESMKIEGDKIRLSFNHVGGGLIAKGGPLTHFTIASENRDFIDAKAIVDGETVVVSSERVTHPIAVRFGWSNGAVPNLFNKAGLPASPFRTDDWAVQSLTAR